MLEASHSMSERLTYCESCNTIDSLVKVLTPINTQYKDNSVGKVVEEYIKETKEELLVEKEKLLKEKY